MTRIRHLIALAIVAAILAVPSAAVAETPVVPAQSARAFGDSVGVNTHMGFADTVPYGDYAPVEARLRELGVRYVRDGLCASCEVWIDRLSRLSRAGIRVNLIASTLTGQPSSLAQNLQVVRTRLAGAIASFEAPNEPDQQGDPLWVSKTRALQQQLYTAVNADPALRDIPVLGPALVYPASWTAFGNQSQYLDRGNMHPYPGGGSPLHNLADLIPLAHQVSGNKPIVATEAGYHSDVNTTSGHYGTSPRSIAIYTPRLALQGFHDGLERTFFYQLADIWRPGQQPAGVPNLENTFGLLNADLSPKPSFLALRNLMRAVDADSAPVGSPGGVRLAVAGAGADVRRLLLRSADGSYALVLWRQVDVWDRVNKRDLTPTPENVTVQLGQPMALAQRFDPVRTDAETARWADPRQIPVALGGEPVVLRLTPPGAAPGGKVDTKAQRTPAARVLANRRAKACVSRVMRGKKKTRSLHRRALKRCCAKGKRKVRAKICAKAKRRAKHHPHARHHRHGKPKHKHPHSRHHRPRG